MDKKTVKAVLDILKESSYRSVCGIQVTPNAIYFGSQYLGVRINTKTGVDNVWVSEDSLREWYSKAKTKDFLTEFEGGEPPIDFRKWWESWDKGTKVTDCAINPIMFKQLAPFGTMSLCILSFDGGKVVRFHNDKVDAVGAPMVKKIEEELCL